MNYYIKTISKSIYQIGFFSYGVSLLFIALSVLIYAQSRIFSNNDIQVELNKNLNLLDSYDNADLNKEETTIAYDSTFQENNDSFNINDLKNIFSKYSYAVENVRIEKKVPDIIISKLPIDFSLIESTNEKKNLFIQSILPLIIKENNKIVQLNQNIKDIKNNVFDYTSRENALFLKKMYKQYKVKTQNIDELIVKVDVIPASIALAQAALESGWGTSRFVLEGNALFGQWSWFKGSGIVPEQRDAEESHEIKIFSTLRGSVAAYMKNLNSNNNYDDFRLARNLYRKNNIGIDAIELTSHLSKYAERANYSSMLKTIIFENKLQDFDKAKLYSPQFEVAYL